MTVRKLPSNRVLVILRNKTSYLALRLCTVPVRGSGLRAVPSTLRLCTVPVRGSGLRAGAHTHSHARVPP